MWCAVTFAALAAARLALAEPEPQLTLDTINPSVIKMEYAVRGELLDRAVQLEKQLNDPEAEKLPFESIVRCNIGNPQALRQRPLSFGREVLSLVMNPDLLEREVVSDVYSADVIARARAYSAAVPSVGAYTDSQGVPLVRREVAEFIAARDGLPAPRQWRQELE